MIYHDDVFRNGLGDVVQATLESSHATDSDINLGTSLLLAVLVGLLQNMAVTAMEIPVLIFFSISPLRRGVDGHNNPGADRDAGIDGWPLSTTRRIN